MIPVHPDQLTPGSTVAQLRDVWTSAGATGTLAFDGDVVASPGNPPAAGEVVDAAGWIAMPPLCDLHAHLDKAYTWEAAGRPEGSLEDAVACWSGFGRTLGFEQMKANGRRQLRAALSAGVLAIRSHANYHEGPDPLRGIRALVELREEFRGLVDLQVVAMHGHDRDDGLVRDGIALGADLVGAAPHLSPDSAGEVARALRLAEEAGIGVDLHTDETLDARSTDLLTLARGTRHWPAERPRSAGHCVSLAVQSPGRLTTILDAVAQARVSIITNPLTNLYLQGWRHPVATPRAIPPLASLLAAGVEVAAGGDNVQDPFNPLGNGDMVPVVGALVLAGHLSPARAWEVAAAGGRRVFGLAPADGRPGDAADVLLVRASSVAEAVAEHAPDRIVIRAGRVVAVRRTAIDTVAQDALVGEAA
ncbi:MULTISPECIES: amidohydrolase family protein [Microbacterium]|uniref:Amidohydrolase n=1 Tax=Microbacterium wangchenii TaxID=2541726 RepID=A0ABX5SSY8_9MICO|nr:MULTISPECIES: amidohydrolase family protein [Microbacterium]MCK6066648.1 amidohydrolase family protein [Microbacterium sp. EYE_512]QBR87980.1 amidohydrolase [Microbacterium wangchenii]TFV83897.1 amidohydrolase [Microbacterium sp. dk485]TXK18230.1 amidohydrolase family protein [Microbacterium wangchenii]